MPIALHVIFCSWVHEIVRAARCEVAFGDFGVAENFREFGSVRTFGTRGFVGKTQYFHEL